MPSTQYRRKFNAKYMPDPTVQGLSNGEIGALKRLIDRKFRLLCRKRPEMRSCDIEFRFGRRAYGVN